MMDFVSKGQSESLIILGWYLPDITSFTDHGLSTGFLSPDQSIPCFTTCRFNVKQQASKKGYDDLHLKTIAS